MVKLLVNGELVEAEADVILSALETLGMADEGGIEVVEAPDDVRDEIERRINERLNDDEEVWLLT